MVEDGSILSLEDMSKRVISGDGINFDPNPSPDITSFIENFRKETFKYVFGTGEYSAAIIDRLGCDFVIDDFTNDTKFHDRDICRLNDVPKGAFVISCAMHSPSKVKSLLDEREINNLCYYEIQSNVPSLGLPKLRYWESAYEIDNLAERERNLFVALDDDLSKNTMLRIVAFRKTGNLNYMQGFTNRLSEMYFEDFLSLDQRSIFYDVGALDGQNSIDFISRFPDYASVVVFEPLRDNVSKVKAALKKNARVVLIEAAVSNESGESTFYSGSGNGSSASLTASIGGQGETVRITTIDEVVNETGLKPDFIKMDIEGAEIMALKGGAQTIKHHKPKLAVSVYHHPHHLLEAYEILSGLRPDYRFRIRHYTEGFAETVLYAF